MAAAYLHIWTVLNFVCLGMESFVLLLLTKNIKDSPKRLKKTPLSQSRFCQEVHQQTSRTQSHLQGGWGCKVTPRVWLRKKSEMMAQS